MLVVNLSFGFVTVVLDNITSVQVRQFGQGCESGGREGANGVFVCERESRFCQGWRQGWMAAGTDGKKDGGGKRSREGKGMEGGREGKEGGREGVSKGGREG